MTDVELLLQCKKGLNIQSNETSFDDVLNQKILMVKSYLKRAGVTDQAMLDDLATGVIVLGVTDLWNTESGEVKFSPVFNTLVSQLAIGG